MRFPGRLIATFSVFVLLLLPACAGDEDADPTATQPVAQDPTGTLAAATPTSTVTIVPTPTGTDPTSSPTQPDAEPETIRYELIDTWGGPVVPQFPYDVSLLPDGRLAVADLGLKQVLIFSPDGALEDRWLTPQPTPEGELEPFFANGIAFANDSLYVSSGIRSGLARFDLDGNRLAEHEFGDTRAHIRELVAGPDGRIFAVSDDRQGVDGVLVFDAELNLMDTWKPANAAAPVALTFDADGIAHVLIYDAVAEQPDERAQPARIARIDPANYAPEVWESPLELPVEGQFDALAIAPDGRYVLVEESSENTPDSDVTTVHIVPADGGDAVRWELPDQGAAGVTYATGLALNGEGNLHITDPVNNQILEVSLAGEVLGAIRDDRPARFGGLGGLSIGPDGNVYAPDGMRGLVHVLAPDGALVETLSFTSPYISPTTVGIDSAVSEDGTVYIVNYSAPPFESFRKISPDGEETVIEVDQTQELEDNFIFHPESVTVGPDGLIYIGMGQNLQVRAYTPDGETVLRWPEDPGRLNWTNDVVSNSDGVFVAVSTDIDGEPAGVIERVDESEEVIAIFQDSDQVETPHPDAIDAAPLGIATGPDGSFFVSDYKSGDILRLSLDGAITGHFDLGDIDVRVLRSIAVDGDERIYLTDVQSREILVYAPAA